MTEEYQRKRSDFVATWATTLDILAEYFNLETAEGQLELRDHIADLVRFLPLMEIRTLTYDTDVRSPEWQRNRQRTVQDLTQKVIKRTRGGCG